MVEQVGKPYLSIGEGPKSAHDEPDQTDVLPKTAGKVILDEITKVRRRRRGPLFPVLRGPERHLEGLGPEGRQPLRYPAEHSRDGSPLRSVMRQGPGFPGSGHR